MSSSTGKGKPSSVTQRGHTEPFEVQISRQDIAYHNQFEVCGYVPVVGTTAGPLWEGQTGSSGLYVYPGSAVVMTFASTSASDLMQVQINGTDINFNATSEIITLNGTSNVNTLGSYYRVNNIVCIGGNNVGTITAKNGGTTYAQINATIGMSQMSIFTVPANFTLLVYSIQAQTNVHYTTTVDYITSEYNKQNLPAVINVNGYQTPFQIGSSTTLSQSPTNALFQTIYQTPSVRPAGTDIQWMMNSLISSGTNASILVSGYLIANTTA